MRYSHMLLRQLRKRSMEPKSIICDICGIRHKVRSHIMLHMSMHINAKNFKCLYCVKTFNTRHLLDLHTTVYHINPNKILNCEFCGALFRTHWNLTVHQRLHTGEQPYTCDQCGQRFVHSKDLVIHTRMHLGDLPYHCSKCPDRFVTRGRLTAHTKASHTSERRHKCDQCDKSFFESTELKRHRVAHTGWQFRCPICEKAFSRRNSKQAHLNRHAGNKVHKCGYCEMAFYSTARRRIHEKTKHKIEINPHDKFNNLQEQSNVGGTQMDNRSIDSLDYEARGLLKTVNENGTHTNGLIKTDILSFEPNVVDETKKQENGKTIVPETSINTQIENPPSPIIEHISSDGRRFSNLLLRNLRHKSGISKDIVCDICGTRRRMRSHILLHMAKHINAKQFKCRNCKKSFNSRLALETHSSIHRNTAKTLNCEFCGALFRTNWNLTVHLRLHTGERPYCCEECGQRFVHSQDLVIHMRLHRGEMPFRCKTCPMRFIKRTELMQHLKEHVTDRRHKCEHCNKEFFESTELKRHMVVHTGYQFTCPVCQKPFSRQNSMRAHMNKHTGVQPHSCRYCTRKFYSTSQRRVHEKTRHPSDVIKSKKLT